MSVRDCQQCRSDTKRGDQCLRRTCKLANLCWQHLKADYNLMVKKSEITGAGMGLYTTVPINVPMSQRARGKKIVQYSSPNAYMASRSRAQINDLYGTELAPYVWCKNSNECYDAKSTQSTVARYANSCDKPGARRPCNARISNSGWIVATRNIPAGGEIFVKYGPEYWD